MAAITAGSKVVLDERMWTIGFIENGMACLRECDTDDIATVSIVELQRANPGPDRLRRFPETTSGPELPDYIKHIRELHDGSPAVGDSPRPQYAADLPMMQRYRAKLEELNGLGYSVSLSTLREHKRKYAEGGPAALIDGRTTRDVRWTDKIDPRIIETCRAVLDKADLNSSTNWSALAGQVRSEFRKEWPDALDHLPALTRLCKILKRLSGSSDPTGSARARDTKRNAPTRVHSPRPAMLPGSEVLLDSTVIDILVRGDDGKPFRPQLALMVDKATRSVPAFSILPTHKAVDIAFLLADANTPPELRPSSYDDIAIQRVEALALPWLASLDDPNTAVFDPRRPAIDIRCIVTDNGAEYRGGVLASACQQLGITIVRSAAFTPTDKGVVERAFRTINTELLCRLPGYTGGSVERRGRKIDQEALLTVEEFVYLLHAWITIVWHNSTHKGLTCPFWPGAQSLTPNQMYAAYFPFTGYVPQPLTRSDYIALMPTVTRTIQHFGLEIGRRTYDSEELRQYRLDPRNDLKRRKFVVHTNPHDLSKVWVELPGVADPVECSAYDRRRHTPHARDVWELADRIRDSYTSFTREQSEDATWDLIDEATRRRDRAAAAADSARRALHLQEVQHRTIDAGVVPVTASPNAEETASSAPEFDFDFGPDEDDGAAGALVPA